MSSKVTVTVTNEYDLERIVPEALGEMLRAWIFVVPEGDDWGYGCYTTFDVRPEARKCRWSNKEIFAEFWGMDNDEWEEEYAGFIEAEAYAFNWFGYQVEVAWYWDGDGMLSFRIWGPHGATATHELELVRWIENNDCKKAYPWCDITDYHTKRKI